jgi:hypothetical protein
VTTLGWVGIGLLIAAGLMIVLEMALAAVWGRAVAKGTLALSQLMEAERGMLESDLEKLRLGIEEMQHLWGPYRTILRWLGHPLTIALWQSYRRRGMGR